ncbi:trypsin-like peptidase domain-containing protein [Candidatus Pacearchaeota archaeon]|nr:trypsin-like peptidase domain-containing protein [Candidatus Pacearchaeota archaeon]
MNLFKKFLWKEELQSITALEDFVNICRTENVDRYEAEMNAYNNLMEFTSPCRYGGIDHIFNGLLITTNGYYITSKHCIEDEAYNDANFETDKSFMTEKICAISKKDDLALAKMDLKKRVESKGKPRAIRYAIETGPDLGNRPITALSRRSLGIVKRFGTITGNYNFLGGMPEPSELSIQATEQASEPKQKSGLYNHFTTSLGCIPGDSGGIILDADMKIMGVVSNAVVGQNYTQAAKFTKALDLIEFYIKTLSFRVNPK